MLDEICKLGTKTNSTNDYGDVLETIDYIDTYCQRSSIRQSEFYQANAVGLKPEIELIIRQEDYNNQEYVIYENVEYKVLRTYLKSKAQVTVTLVRGLHNG